jgi:hypothetical protein
VLWISGDTVLFDGVRQIAHRLEVDTALLHLGGVQFPITGPVRWGLQKTGATGLEPATSGVTGQFEAREVNDDRHGIAPLTRPSGPEPK